VANKHRNDFLIYLEFLTIEGLCPVKIKIKIFEVGQFFLSEYWGTTLNTKNFW